MRLAVAACFLILASFGGRAAADTVHLVDEGAPIEGRIVAEDEDTITLEVEGGRVVLRRSQVDSIERGTAERSTVGRGTPPPPAAPLRRTEAGRPATAELATVGAPSATERALRTDVPRPPPDPRLDAVLRKARTALRASHDSERFLAHWVAEIAVLGPQTVPHLVDALASEQDPAFAALIERAIAAYPDDVPAGPLVLAIDRRGLAASPALVRVAGQFGDAEGASALLTLLAEVERAETAAAKARHGDRERPHPDPLPGGEGATALAGLRAAVVDGLGRNGEIASLERLLALFDRIAAGGSFDSPAHDGLKEATAEALRRALADEASRQRAAELALAALDRFRGPPLAFLLRAVHGVRFAGLVPAIARIVERTEQFPPGSWERESVHEAVVEALGALAADPEGTPDPGAAALLVDLLGDASLDERSRLGIVADLCASGDVAVVPALLDAYELDPSTAVRIRAHAALVRIAGGVNHGGPGAWRRWWETVR